MSLIATFKVAQTLDSKSLMNGIRTQYNVVNGSSWPLLPAVDCAERSFWLEVLHRTNFLSGPDRRSLLCNEMALEAVELLSEANHTDLAFEWSMLCQDCTECWTQTGQKPFHSLETKDVNLRSSCKVFLCNWVTPLSWPRSYNENSSIAYGSTQELNILRS